MDNYYKRLEVSNSSLTQLQKYFIPQNQWVDIQNAYRLGTLVDSVITEPAKVNYYERTIEDYIYTKDEMDMAKGVKNAFLRDEFCRNIFENSEMQRVRIRDLEIQHHNHRFKLAARYKGDMFVRNWDLMADIKSTNCTTQKQFEDSIDYFNYNRQGAWYLDMEERNNFIFLGLCKKPPYPIFKVSMVRGDAMFQSGQAAYQELAFKYWCLFL